MNDTAFKSVVEGLMMSTLALMAMLMTVIVVLVKVVVVLVIVVAKKLTVGSAMHALIGSRSSSCCAVELFFNISTICSSIVRFIVWINSTDAFTFFTLFRIFSHFVRGHFLSMSLRFARTFSYTSVMLLKKCTYIRVVTTI